MALRRIIRRQINTQNVTHLHDRVWGNFKNIRGSVEMIEGDVSRLSGDVSGLLGDVSCVEGDATGIRDVLDLLELGDVWTRGQRDRHRKLREYARRHASGGNVGDNVGIISL